MINPHLLKLKYTLWKPVDNFPTYNELIKSSENCPAGFVFKATHKHINSLLLLSFRYEFFELRIKFYDFSTIINGETYSFTFYDKNGESVRNIKKYAFLKRLKDILNNISVKNYYGAEFKYFCYPHEIEEMIVNGC